MRTLKTILAAGLIAGLPALAQAQWYMGADVGANLLENSDVKGNGNNFKTDYDLGYGALGQAGYSFGALKVEGELGWRRNDVDKVTGGTSSGSASVFSLMGNVLYDFMPASTWHPFVGAGVGPAYVDGKGGGQYSGSDWQFAYQGIAGVGYDLSNNWALKTQYRYFSTLDYDTKDNSSRKMEAEYHSHAILVGFTYKFAPPPAPAPVAQPAAAPEPTPAPPPKVAPVNKNFMVFFDFDKSDLTPEAQKVLAQAATAAKSGGAASIALTGHADRSGSDAYNMKLSSKRGEAVRAALVKLGIPANQISVVAKGESQPLVPTPDGVREPQNRRVEIILP
jgi:outer membrane protein OmpA-like peptidoglycan-associated protein